tara:strand:- start:1107 stop:1472 length:366 start_codon:yes stop_codon:yes gene_type:complete
MKPKVDYNGTIIEFETQEAHDAWVDARSPTPDLSNLRKSLEHEFIGKEVIRALYITLRDQNLTQAQEGDLLGRINGVFVALGFGFIRGAKVLANNLVVAGQLTTQRKDYILAQIDEAITRL